MGKTFTTQEMSEITDLSIHTLRYYERIGLIDPVTRAENGHRRYTQKDITRVDFLKRLRATGMPITEMQHYVALYHAGESTITERRIMLEAHRAGIQAQIDSLLETCALIDGKIARYLAQEAQMQETPPQHAALENASSDVA